MKRPHVLSTRVLLVCAAIGVATGLVGGLEGWLVTPVLAAAPMAYGLLLGVHVLPGIIAQEIFRMPLVALITHVMAALISSVLAPPFLASFIMTAFLFGGIQEIVAALFRYRAWGWWRFLISAVIIGAVVAVPIGFAADIFALPLWVQIIYPIASAAGPILWTLVGLWIGRGLRRAGVSTASRRVAPRVK